MLSTPNKIFLHMERYGFNNFSKILKITNIRVNLTIVYGLNIRVHISNPNTLNVVILFENISWNFRRYHVEIILEVARYLKSIWKILFIPSRIRFYKFSFLILFLGSILNSSSLIRFSFFLTMTNGSGVLNTKKAEECS